MICFRGQSTEFRLLLSIWLVWAAGGIWGLDDQPLAASPIPIRIFHRFLTVAVLPAVREATLHPVTVSCVFTCHAAPSHVGWHLDF